MTKRNSAWKNGSKQFWVINPKLLQVKVSTPDGLTTTYRAGQQIPLAAFGGGALKIDDIFA